MIDYKPEELNLELLSQLQGSLVAKLLLVNQELISRYRSVMSLSQDLPESKANRDVLSKSADRLEKFNEILESELARILCK